MLYAGQFMLCGLLILVLPNVTSSHRYVGHLPAANYPTCFSEFYSLTGGPFVASYWTLLHLNRDRHLPQTTYVTLKPGLEHMTFELDVGRAALPTKL